MGKRSRRRIDTLPHDPAEQQDRNAEPGTLVADFQGREIAITPEQFLSATAFTMTYAIGKFNAKIDTYTLKQYEKSDFQNLIQLLTLWIDDETIKSTIKEMAEKFEGEEFSEEDIDKFILSITLNIDDEKIRNKFEETHQYWKNIVR